MAHDGPVAMVMGDATIPRHLYMRQKMTAKEFCCGELVRNKYGLYPNVEDRNAEQFLLTATEESECCCRCWCYPRHTAKVHVGQPKGSPGDAFPDPLPAYTLDRPFYCCPGQGTATVLDASGAVIGTVDEECANCYSLWCPLKFYLKDSTGAVKYEIVGPSGCKVGCCQVLGRSPAVCVCVCVGGGPTHRTPESVEREGRCAGGRGRGVVGGSH